MEGVTVLGRASDAGIRLHSLQVSRHHAQIECSTDRCRLTDLQSSNGTFVNGRRVSEATLSAGDRVRLGDVELTYLLPGAEAPPSSRDQQWLIVDGVRRAIPAGGLTIGRASDCDLCLSDGQVSRQHARIEPHGAGTQLIDLESANGTYVNGRPVRRHVLRNGDVITLGASRIVYRDRRDS
jgi:pSer/pThr/pTyr-binding forkhead associated (FHA) protein